MAMVKLHRETRPPAELMNAAALKYAEWDAFEFEKLDKKHPRVVGKELAELMTLRDLMPKGYRSKCIASHGLHCCCLAMTRLTDCML
jgi:hypothetical protein